ncbi:hypothetical protein DM860_018230 [Cuscuta australis]|uniref:Uncharacterized protein n=1 Tax=Cuscuta australis TaxID=267555 RepID=A0A328D873_9ASTE|nr:hypothetical protein DM860_018230 [Cuscuta australis]
MFILLKTEIHFLGGKNGLLCNTSLPLFSASFPPVKGLCNFYIVIKDLYTIFRLLPVKYQSPETVIYPIGFAPR